MEALSFSAMQGLACMMNDICPIHGTHMLIMPGHDPFCPQCASDERDKRELGVIHQHMAKRAERATIGVLTHDSIFDDPDALNCTFNNYIAEPDTEAAANLYKARHLAGRYLNPEYRANTILTGNPGTGKTHLAMGMLHAVNDHIQPPVACLFISVNEMTRRVKDSFNNRQSWYTEEHVTRMVSKADLLVLDDLGSESSMRSMSNESSDWTQQFLFGLLNKRKGRTIITTNLNSHGLTKIYNPKLISRMYWGVEKNGGVIKFTDATADKRKDLF